MARPVPVECCRCGAVVAELLPLAADLDLTEAMEVCAFVVPDRCYVCGASVGSKWRACVEVWREARNARLER